MLAENRKNQHIQGARGLFCLMVFLYHVYHSGLGTWAIMQSDQARFAFGSLQYGVELFFGISGIVILPSLARSSSIGNFALERLSRLYPVLWATIAAVSVMAFLAHTRFPPAWMVAASIVIVPPIIQIQHVNPIAWSLDYEITFYALCAAYWSARGKPAMRVAILIVGFLFVLFFPRGTMFIGGVMIASGWLNDRIRRPVHPLLMLIGFLASWQALAYLVGGNVNDLASLSGGVMRAIGLRLGALASMAIGTLALLGIARGEGVFGRLLFSRPMVGMGTISYSFYLWHIPIMAGVKQVLLHLGIGQLVYAQAIFAIVSLPIALAAAILSYRLIEQALTGRLRRVLGISRRRHDAVLRVQPNG